MNSAGREPQDEPAVEHIDKVAEQRDLEAAGWERVESQGKVAWRNPVSGFLYPQGVAVTLVREGADPGNVPRGPEGGA